MSRLFDRRRLAVVFLVVSLVACSSLNPFADPVEGWYKSIETAKFTLVTSLVTIGELHRQGVIDNEEKETARVSGHAAKALLVVANRNLQRFKEGKATEDVVSSSIELFEKKVEEIEADKDRFAARSSPAPVGDQIESEAIR